MGSKSLRAIQAAVAEGAGAGAEDAFAEEAAGPFR